VGNIIFATGNKKPEKTMRSIVLKFRFVNILNFFVFMWMHVVFQSKKLILDILAKNFIFLV
jgi:hypothetical protein